MSRKPKRTRKTSSRKKTTKTIEIASAPESVLQPESPQVPEQPPTETIESPTPAIEPEPQIVEPTPEPTPTPEPLPEPIATQESKSLPEPEPEPSLKQETQPTRKAKKGGLMSFLRSITKGTPKYVPRQRPPEKSASESPQALEPITQHTSAPEPVAVQEPTAEPSLSQAEPELKLTPPSETKPSMETTSELKHASEPLSVPKPASVASTPRVPERIPERVVEPKRETKKLPKEKVRKPKLVKAYLRGVGKGKIKFVDESIKFYTEKGTIRKERQLAKQIPLEKIDDVTFQKGELKVTAQDSTETFVIKDRLYAKILVGKIEQAISKRGPSFQSAEPSAASATSPTSAAFDLEFGVQKPIPKDYQKTLAVALSVVDSLFDILMCLQGRVDWATIGKNAKSCEKDFPKVADRVTLETATLDLSLLVSAATEHNVELTSDEVSRLLESLYTSFYSPESKFPLSNKAVAPYFVLNDIVLGMVVSDPAIGEELSQLKTLLADLSSGTGMSVGEVAEAANRIVNERVKEPYTEQARALYRQQLLVAVPK
jgi:hypothetical protein